MCFDVSIPMRLIWSTDGLLCLKSLTTSFWHIDAVGGRPHQQAVRRLRGAVTLIGFSGSSVRPIVISLRSCTPASTCAGAVRGARLTARARVARDPMPVRAISRSILTEAAWRFGRLQLAEIEIADRLQSLRGGALLQV